MMALEDLVASVLERLIDDRFYQRAIGAGRRLSEVQALLAQAKAGLLAELMACDALPADAQALAGEVEERLLARLAALGLLPYLYSGTLARLGAPRHLRGLNKREAVCLWLGLFREQSTGLAGLWAAYLDLCEQGWALPELPKVIQLIFCVRGEDGEDQCFFNNMSAPAPYQRTLSALIALVMLDHADVLGLAPCSLASAINQVDVNLLRGGNTLKDAYAASIAGSIDGVQDS
jgi:hypothetical protein